MEKQDFMMQVLDFEKTKSYQDKELGIALIKASILKQISDNSNSFKIMKTANIGYACNSLLKFSLEHSIEYFIEQGFLVEETDNGTKYQISWR